MSPLFQSSAAEILPAIEPEVCEFPSIVGAEIAAATYGKRVAGDFYDALRVSTERILFGLLDVAGPRARNGAILSAAQKIFRDSGAELFSATDINESEAMTVLCLRLNRGIMQAAGGVHPCPAFIACYHERFGTLCYCNAGHTPGLLRDKRDVSELVSTGLPLGLFSHTTADAPTAAMEKGAGLLLVSKGVVEARCKEKGVEDPEFGLERVKQHFWDENSPSAQAVSQNILKAAAEFSCEPVVPQDMTAVSFVRRGSEITAVTPHK
jgi:serine phosphatase RsbU (regulator of sigma subunit)